jgi:hypothetical protein
MNPNMTGLNQTAFGAFSAERDSDEFEVRVLRAMQGFYPQSPRGKPHEYSTTGRMRVTAVQSNSCHRPRANPRVDRVGRDRPV